MREEGRVKRTSLGQLQRLVVSASCLVELSAEEVPHSESDEQQVSSKTENNVSAK